MTAVSLGMPQAAVGRRRISRQVMIASVAGRVGRAPLQRIAPDGSTYASLAVV